LATQLVMRHATLHIRGFTNNYIGQVELCYQSDKNNTTLRRGIVAYVTEKDSHKLVCPESGGWQPQ
jgi:hypothetical protein